MTATMTPTLTRPKVPGDDFEAPEVAHWGRKDDVARAYVTGEEIEALCGVMFIPTRDPLQYPVCQDCQHALDVLRGRA